MVSCCNFLKDDLEIPTNSFSHYRCLAHILNIAAKYGLKDIEGPIARVRNLIKKVKYSPTILSRLKDFCGIKKISYLSPCLDVPTRWNSTWAMLDRFIYLYDALILLGAENISFSAFMLNNEEAKLIKVLIKQKIIKQKIW
jgi:hypothetical protein